MEYRKEVRRRELLEPRPRPLFLLLAIGLSYCGVHSAVGGTFSEALTIIREAFGILSLAILGSNTLAALAPTTTLTATGIPSTTPHLGPCVELAHQNEGVNLLKSSRVGIGIHKSCGVTKHRQFIAALLEF